MDIKQFNEILMKLRSWGKYLYFHVKGEPLLHPRLKDFLSLAQEKDFQVTLTTNGSLLNKCQDFLLTSSALRQINISLHSYENPVELNDYLEQLKGFIQVKTVTNSPLINLRVWDLVNSQESVLSSEISRWIQTSYPNGLPNGVFLQKADRFEWPNLNTHARGDTGFCYGLRDQLAILVDGTVVPCCLDSEGVIALGNIFEDELKVILDSPRAMAMYNGFSQRKVVEPLCKTCGFRQRFNK